jgi:N-methylhydantoinase A
VLSAYGMAAADSTRDYVASVLRQVNGEEDLSAVIGQRWGELEAQGRAELIDAGEDLAALLSERSLDMRYTGQSYELEVPVAGDDPTAWAAAFHLAHGARFGYQRPERAVEVVNARLRLRVPGRQAPLATKASSASAAAAQHDAVWFGRRLRTAIYQREPLGADAILAGPAIIVQMDATTVVNPGWQARIDTTGSIILETR